jgi:hypothetical protein
MIGSFLRLGLLYFSRTKNTEETGKLFSLLFFSATQFIDRKNAHRGEPAKKIFSREKSIKELNEMLARR